MTGMKRLTCTLAALTMVIWTYIPVQAEYKGELPPDLDITINFDNSAITGKTAITVFYLGRKPDEIEFTAPAGARVSFVAPKPGRYVTRVIVQVDPPNGEPLIEVSGILHTCSGHTSLVFNVE
jgi:hypothetical protein